MTTFFLVGTTTRKLMEPEDECSKLKVVGPKDTIPNIIYPKVTKQPTSRPPSVDLEPEPEEASPVKISSTCIIV